VSPHHIYPSDTGKLGPWERDNHLQDPRNHQAFTRLAYAPPDVKHRSNRLSIRRSPQHTKQDHPVRMPEKPSNYLPLLKNSGQGVPGRAAEKEACEVDKVCSVFHIHIEHSASTTTAI
jgi:hypothetical protein